MSSSAQEEWLLLPACHPDEWQACRASEEEKIGKEAEGGSIA